MTIDWIRDKIWDDMADDECGFVRYRLYPDAVTVETSEDLSRLCTSLLQQVQSQSEAYFWERESFNLRVPRSIPNNQPTYLEGLVKFEDGLDDEWFVTALLSQLTSWTPGLIVTVEDNDGEFMLIEAAEFLPDWLEPGTSAHRIFLMNGKLHIITPSQLPRPKLNKSLNFLRANQKETLAPRRIQQAIQEKLQPFLAGKGKPVHRARVVLPRLVASLLNVEPRLISLLTHAIMERTSAAMTKAITLTKILGSGEGLDLLPVRVTFTRHQYAALLCQRIETPQAYPPVDGNDVGGRMGMYLALAYELALQNPKCQSYIDKEMSKANIQVTPYDGPDDDLQWLEDAMNEEMDESIGNQFQKFQLSEMELDAVSATMTDETLNGNQRNCRADAILQKFLKATSGFDGVDDCCLSDDGDSDDFDDYDSHDSYEGEDESEDFSNREIFEAIHHDPDLLMKILDCCDPEDTESVEFVKQLHKSFATFDGKKAANRAVRQKGIADIAPEKLKNSNWDCLLNINGDDEREKEDYSEESSDPGAEDIDEMIYTEDERPTNAKVSSSSNNDDDCDQNNNNVREIMNAMDSELLDLVPERNSMNTSYNLEMASKASCGPATTILKTFSSNKK